MDQFMPTLVPPRADAERQWIIDHSGKISKAAFKALIWIFSSFGTAAFVGRMAFRAKTRRFFRDDFIVTLATAFLVAETVVLYYYTDRIFLVEAGKSNADFLPTLDDLLSLKWATVWLNIYNSLAWTAVFLIKASFLVVFWPLTRALPFKIKYYLWFGAVATAISYGAIISQSFIICPYFGVESFKCAAITNYPSMYFGLSLMVFLLDLATDVIIISIPIALLRIAQHMRLYQKIRIAAFLCLSLAMVVISIVRISGGFFINLQGKREISLAWANMLLHIESGVAVLMGSISAFRAVFAGQGSPEESSHPSLIYRIMRKLGLYATSSSGVVEQADERNWPSNPEHTRATLVSLREFIRRHNRESGHTTLESNDDLQDPYHQFIRQQSEGQNSGQDLWQSFRMPDWRVEGEAIELVPYPAAHIRRNA